MKLTERGVMRGVYLVLGGALFAMALFDASADIEARLTRTALGVALLRIWDLEG